MIRHGASDNFSWYVIHGWGRNEGRWITADWWVAKEWIPVAVMLGFCSILWKRERAYAYAGLGWSLVGFLYGFTPYIIKN
jgi:hypothetical protein